MAIHTECGPPPWLDIAPLSDPENYLDLAKFTQLTPVGDFVIHIESDTGQTKTITLDKDSPYVFQVHLSELFVGNNWIRIKMEVDCGFTSYSNAVSYILEPQPHCLDVMGLSHNNFDPGRLTTEIRLNTEGDCAPSLLYRAYHVPEGGGSPVSLSGLSSAMTLTLPDTPKGAGHGEYYFEVYDPATKSVVGTTPRAKNDARNSSAGTQEFPGTSDWRTEFVHADHLGSTRLITDEMGAVVSEFKYYPFGMEVVLAGGADVRMKFTGHERDGELRLDYMKARYCGPSLGRFLSVDPILGAAPDPQTWNRYTYVLNRPILFVDPTGLTVELTGPETVQGLENLGNEIGLDLSNNEGTMRAAEFTGPLTPEQQLVMDAIDAPETVTLEFVSGDSGVLYASNNGSGTGTIDVADIAFLNTADNSTSFKAGTVPLHELAEAFAQVTVHGPLIYHHKIANFTAPGIVLTDVNTIPQHGPLVTALTTVHRVQDGSGANLNTRIVLDSPQPRPGPGDTVPTIGTIIGVGSTP